MIDVARLTIVAERLLRDRQDLRHTVLDVSANFLAASAATATLPAALRGELEDLRREVETVQPQFPSHRKTSVLFDEAGLGQPGRDRAKSIADRIIAVVRALAD